jgi:predicted DNA binding CopG/RHH family protein
MKRIRLSSQEKKIEKDLLDNIYIPATEKDFQFVAESIANRKKDAVLNIRVNSRDLSNIKNKAKKLGVRYQTFISEIIHKIAV